MIIKDLKTDKNPFWSTWSGHKTFEIRYNDRDYGEGDHLLLRETKFSAHAMALDPEEYPLVFTGREILVEVEHILLNTDEVYGLKPGWCVMSIRMLSKMVGQNLYVGGD